MYLPLPTSLGYSLPRSIKFASAIDAVFYEHLVHQDLLDHAMFLTDEELAELTGYRQPARQKRWLDAQGIRFFEGADGRPRVLSDAITRILLGGKRQERNIRPHLERLEAARSRS